MDMNSLEPIGAGAGGGFLGVLLTWLGVKSRLDTMEKMVEGLVTEKTCEARTEALKERVENASHRFDKIDLKLDELTRILMERKP